MPKKKIQDQNHVLHAFYTYWQQRYPQLEDRHCEWLSIHSSIRHYDKGTILSQPSDGESALYIALDSTLVRERYCTHCNKNIILSIALPHMALFTTLHTYSSSPMLGDITVLQSGWVLRLPYRHIQAYREKERAIDTLIDLWSNKKKHQLQHLRMMDNIPNTACKYFYFATHLSVLYYGLNQIDQARILHTSISSIKRAKRLFLKLK